MNDRDKDHDEVLECYLEEGISKTNLPPHLYYLSEIHVDILKALDESAKQTISNNNDME